MYSAASALVWSVVWLEWAPMQWQRKLMQIIYIPLALPSVLWVMGLHRMTINWDVDATFAGLWLVHTLLCVPYVLLAMESPYANFNPALQAVAASLGRSRTAFLLQVKWPLLKATLLAGFAVGFSVSTAQYLATVYVGAGRFATVSTEAINLAAGGQRSMAAAFAWLQWLLPAMVFALAGLLGRPRRFK
jgi:putative thiamine transport system permease protein